MTMIIAGDIGGTKTVLASYQQASNELVQVHRYRYENEHFDSLTTIVTDFCQRFALQNPAAACFGIAGPVMGDEVRVTNLPWIVSLKQLQDKLKTRNVFLLNDLEASAIGLMHLADDELVTLNEGDEKVGHKAVIAPGTGLGEAILFWDGADYKPIATEGGHCEFAPRNVLQDRLLAWLRTHFSDHVSIESIISGPGIHLIYRFLNEQKTNIQSENQRLIDEAADPSIEVSRLGIEKADPMCIETLRLFSNILGAEAGNLALKTLPLAGLYLTGGIPPKILPILQQGDFMRGFTDKGRFADFMHSIPVKVALNTDVPLLGAAWRAHSC